MNIPNSILTTIITETFEKEVGRNQTTKGQKALLVSFRLPINTDKEDGYRCLELLVYGPMNYVGVYVRQTWDIISLDDLDFDDDGDGCPKPGKDYVKTTTAWEQICYHDSGWRTDGIDRIIQMYEDQILGLKGPRWYQVVDAPQEIQSKY